MSRHAQLDDEVIRELGALLGERFTTSEAVREHHGRDESALPPAAPDAVAFPTSAKEVSEIVQVCARRQVPLIPFGAGTSLEGHVLATTGGLCVDLTRMNQIVEVNADDLDITVEAGVTRKQVNERLHREGLFFPIDPGADATIGGMAASGASGTTTVRYGTMRENVLALTVVLADGSIIRTGRRARKSSAGYDLTRLLVGSEGTLGVITEVTLKVQGIPEAISGAICHFGTIEQAVQTVISTLQVGVAVARIEFLDDDAMRAVNEFSGLGYPIAPTLFLEFHGSPQMVAEQTRSVEDIASEFGVKEFRSALGREEREKLWRARHEHFYASLALRPGARAITTDVCVPLSRLADCMLETKRDVDQHGFVTTIVGHAGDGNFHLMIMIDPDDLEELEEAEQLNRRLVARALEMGGTSTGEHGIGIRKRAFLHDEMGAAVETMRAVKRSLDPLNIMNPGKVFLDAPPPES
jgi:D-lactate dehydrogenase (cytochrome)